MESVIYPILISENNSKDVLFPVQDVEFIVFTAHAGFYFFHSVCLCEEAALEKAFFLDWISVVSLFLERFYFQ